MNPSVFRKYSDFFVECPNLGINYQNMDIKYLNSSMQIRISDNYVVPIMEHSNKLHL